MRFLKFSLGAVLAAVAFAGGGTTAHAGFISSSGGNNQFTPQNSPKSWVSYSVFQDDGNAGTSIFANLATALGTTTANLQATGLFNGVDTTANYVYLYQVTQNGPPNPKSSFDAFRVQNPTAYTSAGYLAKRVFTDGSGAVGVISAGAIANKGLGIDDTTADGIGTTGVTPNGISVLAAAINPTSVKPDGLDSIGNDVIEFNGPNFKLGTTSILFLTSNYGPQMLRGETQDGSESSGDIPTAVTPEPGSMALAGFGLVGLLGCFWARRGAFAPAAAA